ncbi:MAG: TetR family transcriptional regulator [Acidobacteria bacterium]|nr:TetR family transcriptional regulator [Acidobacteriota bacterium]
MSTTDTATQLLDTAQTLIQTRGYNAYSYNDLAEAVGIKTASVHYHFPSKADLGVAVMARYRAQLAASLERIDTATTGCEPKLRQFIDIYRTAESCGTMCLCGSLAHDLDTLPDEVRAEVNSYIEASTRWICRTIEAGIEQEGLTTSCSPSDMAATLVGSLQGSLLVSRAGGGGHLVDAVERVFLVTLTG